LSYVKKTTGGVKFPAGIGLNDKLNGLDTKLHDLDDGLLGLDDKLHDLDDKLCGLDDKMIWFR